MRTKSYKKARQGSALIADLISDPAAVALCGAAFSDAYLAWRRGLAEREVDLLPVAEAHGEGLFQTFLALLGHGLHHADRGQKSEAKRNIRTRQSSGFQEKLPDLDDGFALIEALQRDLRN